MKRQLVLSLFPGIGLLDMAFEEEGFCVVRGPDMLFGGDIKRFHPPDGVFHGVIGGPPCKAHSRLVHIVRAVHGADAVAEDLIPEFNRVVGEAAPDWFLMENVPEAPVPSVPGFLVISRVLNNRWLGEEQNRTRRFSFGTRDGRAFHVHLAPLEAARWKPTVTSSSGGRRRTIRIGGNGKPKGNQKWSGGELKKMKLSEAIKLQGLPENFLEEAPFTVEGKRTMIGNGVPLPMGRAVARAVKAAVSPAPPGEKT